MPDNPYRQLPAVNDILAAPRQGTLAETHGRETVVGAVRAELEELRACLKQGRPLNVHGDLDAIVARIEGRLTRTHSPKLVEVINATGIVLHTKLGRAPIAGEAAQAASRA